MSDFARFMAKVHINTQTGCWEWTASRFQSGYGQFKLAGRNRRAHRVAYEFFIGPIPEDDLQADHLCRVKHCVNPYHLEMVTAQVNTLRGVSPSAENAKKTHCPQGHPYDAENTWRHSRGRGLSGRSCRRCKVKDPSVIAPGNRTHCPAGHAYDDKNTRYVKGNMRQCRACDACRQREYRRQRREAET